MQPPQSQQAPKKKSKLGIGCGVIAAVVILFAIIGIASNSGKSSSTTTSSSGGNSTQAPGKPQTWQTAYTYSGNGSEKTGVITVPDDWKINWTCDPTSFQGIQYNVAIEVDNSDNTVADPIAVNSLCSSTNSSGTTEEHQAGNVYLNVTSEAKWSVVIQELK